MTEIINSQNSRDYGITVHRARSSTMTEIIHSQNSRDNGITVHQARSSTMTFEITQHNQSAQPVTTRLFVCVSHRNIIRQQ